MNEWTSYCYVISLTSSCTECQSLRLCRVRATGVNVRRGVRRCMYALVSKQVVVLKACTSIDRPIDRPNDRSSIVRPSDRSSIVRPSDRSWIDRPSDRSSIDRPNDRFSFDRASDVSAIYPWLSINALLSLQFCYTGVRDLDTVTSLFR